MQQQLMPFGGFDHSIPHHLFCHVYPHSPVDLSILENIPGETVENDIWNIGIKGLAELKLFGVDEKKDLKHSDSQRRYRKDMPDLKFGLLYFEDSEARREFEKECAQRQHILFDLELMARRGTAGTEHSFMGTGRRNRDGNDGGNSGDNSGGNRGGKRNNDRNNHHDDNGNEARNKHDKEWA